MGAPRLVPDKRTFERWLAKGLTQRQMVEEIERTTGVVVTRAAVAQAIVRYGLGEERTRYSDEIPWKVEERHLTEYPARMLRLLGRLRAGKDINSRDASRLQSWLDRLEADDVVVAYDPESTQGFHYVPRKTDDPTDIPIRKKLIKVG